MKVDEELLEQLFWEFDREHKKHGDERLTFKSKMRQAIAKHQPVSEVEKIHDPYIAVGLGTNSNKQFSVVLIVNDHRSLLPLATARLLAKQLRDVAALIDRGTDNDD